MRYCLDGRCSSSNGHNLEVGISSERSLKGRLIMYICELHYNLTADVFVWRMIVYCIRPRVIPDVFVNSHIMSLFAEVEIHLNAFN